IPPSTRGTGRKACRGTRSASRHEKDGQVSTVSLVHRPKSPVRLRAYSHWVSRVARRSVGASRHQRTTAAVNAYGMFPATAKLSGGGVAARKSSGRTRRRG